MRGKGRYGWLTLRATRAEDGLQIKLGRAMSHHTARGIAISILRSSSKWSRIDILTQTGKCVERLEKSRP